MSDKLLSTRHVRFFREFLKDGNATPACIRAGYSRHSAQPCASRLMAQPHIAAAAGLTAQDRERYEERCAACERSLNHAKS